jgi:hypothetical protein
MEPRAHVLTLVIWKKSQRETDDSLAVEIQHVQLEELNTEDDMKLNTKEMLFLEYASPIG